MIKKFLPDEPQPESLINTNIGDYRRNTIERVLDWLMPVLVLVLIVVFSFSTESFLTIENIAAMLSQNAATFIVAAIAAMLLMAGFVDLSVGSALALVGVVAGLTFNSVGILPGILAGLSTAIAIGFVNGALIGFLRLDPIVVTLGGLVAWRALALWLTPEQVYGFPPSVSQFAVKEFLGISTPGWTAVLVSVIALIVMAKLPLGRRLQAVGVNSRAAYLVGISVKPTVFWLYTVVGAAVGLAALVQIARLDSAPAGTLGVGFEITVLTAILLGGVPFRGGRGEVWRVLLAVMLLAILRNGLVLLNFGTEVAGVVTGLVLVLAAGLQALSLWAKQRF